MSNNNVFLPVNWIDGMKINKDHFIASDNSVTNQLKNAYLGFLTPLNYGLLVQTNNDTPSLQVIADVDNQSRIHVKLINCRAITQDGIRIDIQNNYFSSDELSHAIPQALLNAEEAGAEEIYIALSVNHKKRIPFGVPSTDEVPPRLPHVLPAYNISLLKKEDLASVKTQNSLVIGKLRIEGNKPELDEYFIPPCQTVYSHPKLIEYHAQLVKLLGQIEVDIVDILKRIKDKKQTTTIAQTVAIVSEAVLTFISVNMVEFRTIAKYQPPVLTFEHLASLARVINNSINKQASTDREELLNYIQDWSTMSRGDFEDMLTKAVQYNYKHNDINDSITRMTPFINAISGICNTLSNLDFIGKKKDRQIFVKEQKDKPGSSFLVD